MLDTAIMTMEDSPQPLGANEVCVWVEATVATMALITASYTPCSPIEDIVIEPDSE